MNNESVHAVAVVSEYTQKGLLSCTRKWI